MDVFVTARSAVGSVGFVSVALLLPGIGSVTPAGGATVAVLEIAPTVPFATVPVMVRVAAVARRQIDRGRDVAAAGCRRT